MSEIQKLKAECDVAAKLIDSMKHLVGGFGPGQWWGGYNKLREAREGKEDSSAVDVRTSLAATKELIEVQRGAYEAYRKAQPSEHGPADEPAGPYEYRRTCPAEEMEMHRHSTYVPEPPVATSVMNGSIACPDCGGKIGIGTLATEGTRCPHCDSDLAEPQPDPTYVEHHADEILASDHGGLSGKDANDPAPDSGKLLGKLAAATHCTPAALTAGPGAECFTMTMAEGEQVLASLLALKSRLTTAEDHLISPPGAAALAKLAALVRSIAQGVTGAGRPEHVGVAPVPPAAKRPWQCPPGWKIGADCPDKDPRPPLARARSPHGAEPTFAERLADYRTGRRIDEDAAEAALGDDEQA